MAPSFKRPHGDRQWENEGIKDGHIPEEFVVRRDDLHTNDYLTKN